jgi:hypothetical protein
MGVAWQIAGITSANERKFPSFALRLPFIKMFFRYFKISARVAIAAANRADAAGDVRAERGHGRENCGCVEMKMMPPWFADPRYGHFSNDPSLSAEQIATIGAWAKAEHRPEMSAMRPRHGSGVRAGIFRSRMWW